MEELKDYIAGLVETFGDQPSAFRTVLGSMADGALHRPLEPGGWTPHQVMAHVLASESEALLPRIERILDESDPDLPNWDETEWMANSYDPKRATADMLAAHAAARHALEGRLAGLPLEDWNRAGTHPTRGRRTALWWVEYTVAHAKDHLNQLSA